MRSRMSAPDTGDAVVAMRMMECVRSMRYRNTPSVQKGHQSATVLPSAWDITKKATQRSRLAMRDS